jgi:hypothetical protein
MNCPVQDGTGRNLGLNSESVRIILDIQSFRLFPHKTLRPRQWFRGSHLKLMGLYLDSGFDTITRGCTDS